MRMEKRRPHHDLEAFKQSVRESTGPWITGTALQSARQLGYGKQDIEAVIASIRSGMFYKSMTSYVDPRRWRDVYHVPGLFGELLYVKFTDGIVTSFVLLSFKRR